MSFDPTSVPNDQCANGHLDDAPLHLLLAAMTKGQSTGRLSIADEDGENHLFYMRGQPVGVELSRPHAPLGQLVLAERFADSASFMRAQREIVVAGRMAGQVFIEANILAKEDLAGLLNLQSRFRFERFSSLKGRAFSFCAGLSFLSGFQRQSMDANALLFLAQRGQIPSVILTDWLESLSLFEVKSAGLPAALPAYGFGPSEGRFLQRIGQSFEPISDLFETGTLPRESMAILLYHLDKLGRLEKRAPQKSTPEPIFPEALNEPSGVFAPAFRSRATDPSMPHQGIHNEPTHPPTPVSISFPSEHTLTPRKKKKRRQRRAAAEPSEGMSAISETRRERTEVGPLPSVVLPDE